MTSPPPALNDRYRLHDVLGRGGMSVVYRATDERDGGEVAVKIVRSGDPALAQRLAQEARALGRFDHPGLVRLLDAGVTDHGDQAYLVMERVDGPSLDVVLRKGAMEPARVARLGRALAGALASVHAQRVVHRDVKPANVLIGTGERARLADFGIARMLDASTITVTGTTMGTVAYMAPEQLEDHQVGPSADLWSLGMVLLECLTGRRVYEGPPSAVVARRLAGPVPVPSWLPVPWRMLLAGMLDHRPTERPTSAQVASLLEAPVFEEALEPAAARDTPAIDEADPSASTEPRDLTALASAPAVTRRLGTLPLDPARQPVPVEHGSEGDQGAALARRRRRWLVAVPAVALVALVSALGASGILTGSGAASRHDPSPSQNAAHRPATTTSTTTGSTTTTTAPATTTTTAPPSAPDALAALVRDVASGVASGSVPQSLATSLTTAAEHAVTDVSQGQADQAAAALQQAATTVARAASDGSLASSEAAALQSDLETLAGALGLAAAATPTTTTTSAAPSPGPAPAGGDQGPGHGRGHRG